jgi:two-component system, cell cycle sensor histidine kinase and response regulator CckA
MQRLVLDDAVSLADEESVGHPLRLRWRYASDGRALGDGLLPDRLPPDDRARFLTEIARALMIGQRLVRHADHRITQADGHVAWWHTVTTLRPTPDGGASCVSHAFDVTALRDGPPTANEIAAPPDDHTRIQALIDSIPDLIFFKDPHSVYLGCNRAFADFMGRTVAGIVGRTDHDLVSKDRAVYFQERDADVLRHRTSHRMEERVDFPDGRSVLLETIKTPYYGPSGAVMGLVAVARDITAKARAERERWESERRLATLLGNLPGMAYRGRTDAERSMLFVSEGGQRLTGHHPNDLIDGSVPFGALIHPADREHVRSGIDAALGQRRRFTLSYRLIDRDGGARHVWEQGVGVADAEGRITTVEGFVTDISELKTAEDTLRTLSLAVAQSPVAVLIADALGKTIYLNPRFRMMTGRAPDVVPDLDAFIACIAASGPLAVTEHHPAMWRALSAGESWQTELPGRKSGGEHFWAAIRVAPMLDGDGRMTNLIATMDDVTDRRQAEEQVRRAQKMQAVGVLAGGVAHDFNNILTAILGYSHLALDALPSDSDVRDDLRHVTSAANRAKGLVQQLLAFARKEKLEREPMDLRDIARDAVELVEPTILNEVEWTLRCGKEPAPVLAAPSQLHQVIVNLCKNAVDAILENAASDEGERRVTLAVSTLSVTAPRNLARSRLDTGRYARLTVSDTGCGMSPTVQERIFDPFFTTKPVDKGTGLGLAAVHGIVADHGGVIDVTSAPGKGTTISIFLPLHDPDTPRRRQDDARRVLLLDSERTMLGMASRLLRSQGFRVTASVHSRRGLALFSVAPERFDIVVLVQSATEPTWRLLTLARAFAAASPGVPILLCADVPIDREEAAIQAAGITRVLPTPIAPDPFVALVRQLCLGRPTPAPPPHLR